jgi:FtsP/CotA-like multicopper oxidase with cupredoxin domain
MPFRELAGALVIDPAGGQAAPLDRIFVITEWSDLTAVQLRKIVSADDVSEAFWAARPRFTFVINGLSWPATERLHYRRGDVVRWRVINLSSQAHPMHLHGFYFRVTRTGNGWSDEPINGGAGREVVTELLRSGGTVSLEWTPEREGNWLFHCHIMAHVSPARRLPVTPSAAGGAHVLDENRHHSDGDPALGMAGMVIGITVLPTARAVAAPAPTKAPRRIRMVIGADPARGVAMGVAVHEGSTDSGRVTAPGPPLVLRRGEPAEITVVNHLNEATSIHWHGLEIESYYDGVHGWSGVDGRTAPMIAPGASFVVRLAPPRTGTFIYHTHIHDYRQLSSGIHGALIVTAPDAAFDPAVDHVIVIGRRDASEASSVLEDRDSVILNGARSPRWVWSGGATHRIRLINITPDDLLRVTLVNGDATTATWRVVAKDGSPVPADRIASVPATVTLAVGETIDVEYDPAPNRSGTRWLEVRGPSGKWQAQGQVILK